MSNRITTIIAGWNHWYDCTLPAIRSILKYETRPNLLIVDNGSDTPYPHVAGTYMLWAKERRCYQAGLNAGIKATNADWHLTLNNDVLCMGRYLHIIRQLDPSVLWCANINKTAGGIEYIQGWLFLLSRQVIERVGLFDEYYDGNMDDTDYTFAAKQAGVEFRTVNLPFVHLQKRTRRELPGYREKRKEAILYFEKKWGVSTNEIVINA